MNRRDFLITSAAASSLSRAKFDISHAGTAWHSAASHSAAWHSVADAFSTAAAVVEEEMARLKIPGAHNGVSNATEIVGVHRQLSWRHHSDRGACRQWSNYGGRERAQFLCARSRVLRTRWHAGRVYSERRGRCHVDSRWRSGVCTENQLNRYNARRVSLEHGKTKQYISP